MRVDWIKSPKKVQWLGLVTGDRTQAKILLTGWGKANPNVAPVKDYGSAQDLIGSWTTRDQQMMDAFIDWWTAKGGQPTAFKQAPGDTPSSGEVAALQAWVATAPIQQPPLTPGQFPSSGAPIPILFPISVLPTGWPTNVNYPPPKPAWWPIGLDYPPIGTSWSSTVPPWWTAAGASLPNWPPPKPEGWPATFPWPIPPENVNAMSCEALCDAQFGQKGTNANASMLNSCKLVCQIAKQPLPVSPGGGPARFVPGSPSSPGAGTTTSSKSNLPLILGGAALLGLGWFFFMRRGAMLQENAPGDVKVHLSRVHIDRQGYDRRGSYFGVGKPLYEYSDDSGDLHGYVRAYDRQAAKAEVRAKAKNKGYPGVNFYRG